MQKAEASAGALAKGKRIKIRSDRRTARLNAVKIGALAAIVLICVALYLLIGLNFSKWKFVAYSLNIRIPKLVAMLLAAYAIGAASLVFQTIINNRIVTPCLLGMNGLYTLSHTVVVFTFGVGSALVLNANLTFAVDLVIMIAASLLIYGLMFRLTRRNVLYILLIGTCLTSLFSSIQSTIVMAMDPNDYETLLQSITASFESINTEILVFSACILAALGLLFFREVRTLDVMALGKDQAVNLGVDYDKNVGKLLLGVTAYIAVATAMVGPISFLGLIIANLSREFFKTFRHGQLILGTTLFGMIILIGGQVLVEHVFNYAVPVSVFILLIGGGYFLYLLLRRKK